MDYRAKTWTFLQNFAGNRHGEPLPAALRGVPAGQGGVTKWHGSVTASGPSAGVPTGYSSSKNDFPGSFFEIGTHIALSMTSIFFRDAEFIR
ncbi:hypothetical protein SDC9_88508 [bioreactor metagenome]|uniref:Uncharacterized protein n=1 Tax=bioreactor metagenome TaxID=1076179 RepID=A0A644ZNA5_9ZZZZ